MRENVNTSFSNLITRIDVGVEDFCRPRDAAQTSGFMLCSYVIRPLHHMYLNLLVTLQIHGPLSITTRLFLMLYNDPFTSMGLPNVRWCSSFIAKHIQPSSRKSL